MTVSITELTPLSFLLRAAEVYADRVAIRYGDQSATYAEFFERVEQHARVLISLGITRGDRVAYLMPNTPSLLAAHFAVPLAEGVLVALNTRLAGDEIVYILEHSGASVLLVDPAFTETIATIRERLSGVRSVVVVGDALMPAAAAAATVPGAEEFDDVLRRVSSEPHPLSWSVEDETSPISINYTSGTTGRPKGVVYTHRGAYLNALGEIHHSRFTTDSVYLWTLPMFHCNGWCTTWALIAAGGTHVCVREVRADTVWEMLHEYGVDHLNGAPTVLTMLLASDRARRLDEPVVMTLAGAPPTPTALAEAADLGIEVIHVYGLTETYGPYTVCIPDITWRAAEPAEQARLRARQGVAMLHAERVRVVDPESPDELRDVPRDGATLGEVVMRGNGVMKEYYRDPTATAEAFRGGWFHSGDIGVMHPDGYIEIRDRAKDVIISGGENISTIQVEQALAAHPGVSEAAVIGVPDAKWGERPKAFVVVRPGSTPTPEALQAHVRSRLAGFKVPRDIQFVQSLPKTSTGKVQKHELRRVQQLADSHGERP